MDFVSGRTRPTSKTLRLHGLIALCIILGLQCANAAIGGAHLSREHIAVGQPPSAVVLSHDGQTLYIGLSKGFGAGGGIAVYRPRAGMFAKVAEFAASGPVVGLAVTSDERTIVVTTPVGLMAVDAHALLNGNAIATAVREGDAPGTNQLVISPDNRYVFFTNSRDATLGVAQLHAATSAAAGPELTIVGHVALDRVPGGLALSHDGHSLFIVSEIDNVDPAKVPGADNPGLGRTRCDINLGPSGVLTLVSVERAIKSPQRAVLARTAAGCGPVRVSLAPADDVVWVSVRGEARVLAFDVGRLRHRQDALLASVAVGQDPVGLAVSSDNRSVLVANSNSLGEHERGTVGSLSLLDVDTVLHGRGGGAIELPGGERLREVVAASDGSYFITDYDGRSIDHIIPER